MTEWQRFLRDMNPLHNWQGWLIVLSTIFLFALAGTSDFEDYKLLQQTKQEQPYATYGN